MGRERTADLKLSSIIANKYLATRKLGEGGCGVIYEVAQLNCPVIRIACKAELAEGNKEEEILKLEGKVLKKMNESKAIHAGKFIEEGKEENYNYLMMTLLGPALSDLRKFVPDQKFSLFTCVAIAIQCLDALKELHDIGDVKPSNFAVGMLGTSRENMIYILDFGLARSYLKTDPSGQTTLRGPRKIAPFRGTARYCSTNAHAREEQGRHDDLWSWMYMLTEMYLGDLPWRNLDKELTERTKIASEAELFAKCPKEFELAVIHIKSLTFGSVPNYQFLRDVFCQVYQRKHMQNYVLDWDSNGKHKKIFSKLSILSHYNVEDQEKVNLHKVLNIPKTLLCLKEEHALGGAEKLAAQTNSSYDDTLEDSDPKKKSNELLAKNNNNNNEKKQTSGAYSYKKKADNNKKSYKHGVNSKNTPSSARKGPVTKTYAKA